MEKVYTVKDVQGTTKLARGTVMRLINEGKLHAVRAGRRILVPGWALEAFLRGAE
jgi:excisionase family DNA binding protein